MAPVTVRSCSPDVQRVFNQSPHPYLVLCTDPDFTIVDVNDSYLEITRTKRQDLIGRAMFAAFPENPYDRTVMGTDDLRTSLERVLRDRIPDVMGVQKYDIPLRDETGQFEVRYWSPVNTPIFGPDGKVTHILHHVEDVTDFIQLQEQYSKEKGKRVKKVEARPERIEAEILRRAVEVKEANRRLKTALEEMEKCNIEVTTNAQKLEAARNALEASKNQADVYIDLMGHDINNLNQVAMSFIDLTIESFELKSEARSMLDKSMSALDSISRLIDHVGKLRKAGEHGLSSRIFNLSEVLREVMGHYSHIPGRDITINFSPTQPCKVLANDLIWDVFSNLIGNSVKHSDPGLPLIINVGMGLRKEGEKTYCLVTVEDNGPGIPDELKGRLFGRFERGQTKVSGKGLGLFLIKTLVEDFHGKVWIEDRVPGDHTKGARFVVMLPAIEE
ncbi:ATP-binding protein [Methanocella sp. MCL-LM]|uniref:ATP-binding protein n=1 Tax=Methanocella sp. MCL-LM TaxID=3412035 RepID=UPI003C7880DC